MSALSQHLGEGWGDDEADVLKEAVYDKRHWLHNLRKPID